MGLLEVNDWLESKGCTIDSYSETRMTFTIPKTLRRSLREFFRDFKTTSKKQDGVRWFLRRSSISESLIAFIITNDKNEIRG